MIETTKIIEVTESCFAWCKEQNFIHEKNLEIHEMAFIVIALISIVVYWKIINHWEYFRSQGNNENFLEKVSTVALTLNFIMLIMFIIYMVFLR